MCSTSRWRSIFHKLQLAAASFHFADTLGQFNGVAQTASSVIWSSAALLPRSAQFRARAKRFNSSASRLILTFLTDPDNFIVFVFDVNTGERRRASLRAAFCQRQALKEA